MPRGKKPAGEGRYRTAHEEYLAEMRSELGETPDPEVVKALAEGKVLPAIASRNELLECIESALEVGRKDLRPRNYMMMRLFYATGVREAEMAGFTVGDVFDNRRLQVRGGKGGKDRIVGVDPATMALLREFLGNRPKDDSLMGIHERQIYNVVVACGEATGLVQKYAGQKRHFSPHAFRHGFATHATERRMRPYVLKKLLGHEHLKTTEMYVHLAMDEVMADYDATNPLTHPEPGGRPDPAAPPGPRLEGFPGPNAPTPLLRAWVMDVLDSAPTDVTVAVAILLARMAPTPVGYRWVDEDDVGPEVSDDEVMAAYDRCYGDGALWARSRR